MGVLRRGVEGVVKRSIGDVRKGVRWGGSNERERRDK